MTVPPAIGVTSAPAVVSVEFKINREIEILVPGILVEVDTGTCK